MDVSGVDGEPLAPSQLLFAYGTLVPVEPDRRSAEGWEPDAVRGRLYDLGPYPALVDLDDPGASWVEGCVRPITDHELINRLDPYEGVVEGLYRRDVTITRAGRPAWIYTYAPPLPAAARGPIEYWRGNDDDGTRDGPRP
jgi:gamma-glutamylcyclotransferase (GGCT)/AIG2-like uncharacterized protein YtfP